MADRDKRFVSLLPTPTLHEELAPFLKMSILHAILSFNDVYSLRLYNLAK